MVNNEKYILYTDGACIGNPGQMGIGCAIYNNNKLIKTISEKAGFGTNNEAEYLAMIAGLKATTEYKPKAIFVYSDSQLVVNQVNGEWKIKKNHLEKLCEEIFEIINKNKNICFEINWISRNYNKIADNLASSAIGHNQGVFIDGKLVDWNEVVEITSLKERDISSLPKVNFPCEERISFANDSKEPLRFRDFLALKTNGKDFYSFLTEEELFKIIEIRFGEETVDWIIKALENSDENFKKSAIRWIARGLYPNLALKKASVDEEMQKHKKYSKS